MPLDKYTTKQDLALHLGVETNYIAVLIQRKKLILGSDGLIDTTSEINKSTIASIYLKRAERGTLDNPKANIKKKKQEIKVLKIQEQKTKKRGRPTNEELEQKLLQKQQEEKAISDEDIQSGFDLKLKSIQADLELKRERKKMLEVQTKKLQGSLIDFKEVEKTLSAYISQFRARIFQAGENMIVEVAGVADLEYQQVVEMKKRWKDDFNARCDEVLNETIEAVKDISNQAKEQK